MAELAGADTCVAPVQEVAEIAADPQFAWRGDVVEAKHPGRGAFRQVAPVLAGMPSLTEPVCVPDDTITVTDTDELLGVAGLTARTRLAELHHGRGWHRVSRRGRDRGALIDVPQYEEAGEFPVERSYIWTSCGSVENGNPLFWDDAVAEEITGGPIAPPTMLSVWFRPHHWAPGRSVQGPAAPGPLRPEGALRAARGGHDRQHHRVPRAGAAR